MKLETVSCGNRGEHMSQTILILDDEPDNVHLIEETIRRNLPDVHTIGFCSPREAATWCEQNEPDLCLIDYKMPGMSGIEFMAQLRRRRYFQSVPIIMITGQPDAELQQRALESGVIDFLSKPINVADVVMRTRNHLRLRDSLCSGQKESAQQIIEDEQAAIIQRLTRLSGYRDEETGNHMRRMAYTSNLIARELGLARRYCEMLLLAAPMHDIGKVGIPDHILLKPGPLDEAEWKVMQTHARIGYDLLKGGQSELMHLGAEIALTHHEKYNGEGYPNGFSGETIPLSGRIVATADVFDALVNARHYKKAWVLDDAVHYMRNESGRHLDPGCVNVLLQHIDDVVDIQNNFTDDCDSTSKNMSSSRSVIPKSASA
jgi:response regulator RpfG family c-di-GMP phosphodiesterase